jgi:hypothetical protein
MTPGQLGAGRIAVGVARVADPVAVEILLAGVRGIGAVVDPVLHAVVVTSEMVSTA